MQTYTYKLCLFGPGGVGKTILTRGYLTGLMLRTGGKDLITDKCKYY